MHRCYKPLLLLGPRRIPGAEDLFIFQHAGGDDEERGETVLASVFCDYSNACLP